jgi:hypothetical protein
MYIHTYIYTLHKLPFVNAHVGNGMMKRKKDGRGVRKVRK